MRVFQNYANYMENHPNIEGWQEYLKTINGKRYLLDSDSWTASPEEVHRCDLLKKHIEYVQRYVDPSIIIVDDRSKKWLRSDNVDAARGEIRKRANMMGLCHGSFTAIKDEIPTNPPCKPHVVADGEVTEGAEKET